MVTLKDPGGSIIVLDEGRYTAKLTAWEERESRNIMFPEPQVLWHFVLRSDATGEIVMNDSGQELDFWVFTSRALGPRSNAGPMVEALLHRSIESSERGADIARDIEDGISAGTLYASVMIADSYLEDGSQGNSRPVKGSWRPVKVQAPAPTSGARRPAPAAAHREPASSPEMPPRREFSEEELSAVPF